MQEELEAEKVKTDLEKVVPYARNSHRRNNLSNLCIEGSVTSKQEVIKDTITQYYKNLFTETAPWRPKLDGLEFPCLDSSKDGLVGETVSRGGGSSSFA
jgi:hypothetical protein